AFPSRLEPVYGDFPVSWHAFVRMRWGRAHGGQGDNATLGTLPEATVPRKKEGAFRPPSY
ncbi:MAG: hypothetical protein ABI610_01225, partial [Acidobacteriota bacterium]